MNRRYPSRTDCVAKEREGGNETKFGWIHRFGRESHVYVSTTGLLDVDKTALGIRKEDR